MHFPMCFWHKELVRKGKKKKSIDQIKGYCSWGTKNRPLRNPQKYSMREKKITRTFDTLVAQMLVADNSVISLQLPLPLKLSGIAVE